MKYLWSVILCREGKGAGAIEIGDNVCEGALRINSKMTGKAVRPQMSLSVHNAALIYVFWGGWGEGAWVGRKYNKENLTYKSVENTHKQIGKAWEGESEREGGAKNTNIYV